MAWNRPNSGEAESFPLHGKRKPSILKRKGFTPVATLLCKACSARGICFSTLAVVIIAIAGAWWLWPERESAGETPAPRTKQRIREVTPAISEKPNVHTEPKSANAKPILGRTPTGKEYIAMTAETNADGVVVEQYQLAHGTWMQVVQLQSRDTLIFDNDFDLQLAIIGTTPPTRPLPPFPPIKDLEAAFEKAVKTPIIITAKDSEKTREMKEAAIAARQQIADLMAEGYTIEQILSEDNSLRQKNIEYRRTFQDEVNEIYRKEGEDAARSYLEAANEKLEKVGIVPLTMPGTGKKKRRKSQE